MANLGSCQAQPGTERASCEGLHLKVDSKNLAQITGMQIIE
jgi:hypothetical protein